MRDDYMEHKARLMFAEEHPGWWDEDTKWFADEVSKLGWAVDDVDIDPQYGIEMVSFRFEPGKVDSLALMAFALTFASAINFRNNQKDGIILQVPFYEAIEAFESDKWKSVKQLEGLR